MLPASTEPTKKSFNDIVTATGSVVGEGIVKCLKLANSQNEEERKFTYNIISVDMRPLAPGRYRGSIAVIVPSPESSSNIEKIIGVSKKYGVKAIFVG